MPEQLNTVQDQSLKVCHMEVSETSTIYIIEGSRSPIQNQEYGLKFPEYKSVHSVKANI